MLGAGMARGASRRMTACPNAGGQSGQPWLCLGLVFPPAPASEAGSATQIVA